MTFRINYTRSIYDLDAVKEILGLAIVDGSTLAIMRSEIYRCIDHHFSQLSDVCLQLYNSAGLKSYWFQIDTSGLIIGRWKPVSDMDHLSFRLYKEAMSAPYVPPKLPTKVTNA